MAVSVSSTRRQRVIYFTTPKVADLVVVEVVDSSKNVSSADAADNTAYGTPHPNTTKFENFKLVLIKNADDEQGQFQYWYYVKDRANQDDYNWEFQAAGGSSPLYDTVVRTYVLLRSTYQDTDASSPPINTFMPSTSADPFNTGSPSYSYHSEGTDTTYVLFDKRQVRSGDESLDSLYVTEQRIYVKKVPIRRIDIDKEFDLPLRTKETIFYKSEIPSKTVLFGTSDTTVAESNSLTTSATFAAGETAVVTNTVTDPDATNVQFWGTGAFPISTGSANKFGIMCSGRQLTDNWYALREEEVIKTDSSGLVKSYDTYQSYYWPPVLSFMKTENWKLKDGGHDPTIYPVYKRSGYKGPTKILIQQYWKEVPWTSGELTTVIPMFPEPLVFNTPLGNVTVPECLHERILLKATTGTNHNKYDYIGTTWDFLATNHTDWPPTIIISDSQKPFRGGYLREKVTASKPAS
jgi:hypothetical protein